MVKIGITGGIGSGKSYVCDLLRQRGIPVYHCDDEAKRLMQTDPHIRRQLGALLGEEAYLGTELNKAAVARFLFASAANGARINAIVHPVVRQDFARWAGSQHGDLVAQECALLFETGFEQTVDTTVEVYAPYPLRLARAMQRDHATEAQIRARMAQQMDEEEKRRRADFCIVNDGTADLDRQIDRLLNELRETTTIQSKRKQYD